jgi:hypothetical protein
MVSAEYSCVGFLFRISAVALNLIHCYGSHTGPDGHRAGIPNRTTSARNIRRASLMTRTAAPPIKWQRRSICRQTERWHGLGFVDRGRWKYGLISAAMRSLSGDCDPAEAGDDLGGGGGSPGGGGGAIGRPCRRTWAALLISSMVQSIVGIRLIS